MNLLRFFTLENQECVATSTYGVSHSLGLNYVAERIEF
jgi:hypothetical protein